ncbi:MAG TPA: hypothetical protein VG871_10715, partial [Vicinamibacterales bacterium]|nr:hypothetical protein [Vicinamibacterales bacterium]
MRPLVSLIFALVTATAAPAAAADAARAAVVRALPMLQRAAQTFVEKRACFSCHHNGLSIMALRMADRRGIAVDARVLDAVETRTFRALRGETALDDAVQAAGLSDPTPNDSLLLVAAHAARLPGALTTAVYA